MKMIMLAALAAAIATPAIAQTAPEPAMQADAPATAAANQSDAVPMTSPAPATSDYPMCSRAVTDHCTERSNARGARLHSTPRPPRG